MLLKCPRETVLFIYYLYPWSLCFVLTVHQHDRPAHAAKRNKASLWEMFEVSRVPRVSPWWAESMQALPVIKQRVVTHHSGRDVTFRCHAFGHPRPRVSWYKNGREITDIKRKVWQHGWRLVLPSVRWEDTGIYSCRVKNRYGEIYRHFVLDVKSKHIKGGATHITNGYPHNLTVNAGETAVLECRVDDMKGHYHHYHIQWARGKFHHLLSQQREDPYLFTTDGSSQKLILMNVQPSQTGYYTCLVSGIGGLRHHSAWLRVLPSSASAYGISSLSSSLSWTSAVTVQTTAEQLLHTKDAYIRGVALAVAVSSVVIMMVLLGFCVAAVMQARRREDVVLQPYNLK